MGRKSAIKVMSASMAHDPDAVARFNREAKNASQINHPNVCAIYDFGETPEGLIFLAMEFIEGEPLTALVAREGSLALPRAVDINRQVAEALQAAHDRDIVHRDLKPDNIMLTRRGGRDQVKVVDFGIAKAVGAEHPGQQVTKTGFVVGTPEFMSPEQLSGDPLDGRSDVYTLGLVFYQMVTGTLPFLADSAQEAMVKRLTDDPIPLAEARPDLEFAAEIQAVLDRVLARRAPDRYASATAFSQDLAAAAGGGATVQLPATRAGNQRTQLVREPEAGAAQPPAVRVGAPKPKRRRPVAAIVIGLVAVIGAGTAGVIVLGSRTPAANDSTTNPEGPETGAPIALGDSLTQTQPPDSSSGSQPGGTEGQPSDPRQGSGRPANPVGGQPGTAAGRQPDPPPRVDIAAIHNTIIVLSRNPTANIAQLRGYALDESLPDSLKANAAGGLAEAYIATNELDSALAWAERAHLWDRSKPGYQQTYERLRRILGRSS
jgi:serine/threonine-protein kinase